MCVLEMLLGVVVVRLVGRSSGRLDLLTLMLMMFSLSSLSWSIGEGWPVSSKQRVDPSFHLWRAKDEQSIIDSDDQRE